MKIHAFIQSRLNSNRLPCKALLPLGSHSILSNCIQNTKKSKIIEQTILLTSSEYSDNLIYSEGVKNDINVYRGSLNNVFDRFYSASIKFNSDIIVRLTADNPFINSLYIDSMINEFFKNNVDYHSNKTQRKAPIGLDVEIFKASLLEYKKYNLTDMASEHVTYDFYNNNNDLKISSSLIIKEDYSKYSITIDDINDYIRCTDLYNSLHKYDFKLEYLLKYIKNEKKQHI